MTKKQDKHELSKNAIILGSFDDEREPGETMPVLITDTLKDNFMPYAMSVIVSRAIPEIDGFKPSHRKILYMMYRMGLMKGPRAKCADIVGQTMALNPHGDQSIYDTLVRMTRGNGTLLHPWIDSKGNFGKVYSRDMQCAAYRYTEARLDSSCVVLFDGLEKNSVDFVDNYSGTMKEPVLLPTVIPTVLINANQGIAVGMASNIASFNMVECCEAVRLLIKDPTADLMEVMPAPDFSTGGYLLYDRKQMAEIYESGRGSFRLAAKVEKIEKEGRIEITEIPYNTTIEAIIDEITKAAKQGKLKEINDVRDETDLNGLRITVDCKKNADLEFVLQKLYRLTSLESSFSCNFNILIEGRPVVLGVREILQEWLKWRRSCLSRELEFNLGKISDKLHLLRALESILLDIDRAIRIIRGTEREEDVIPHLMAAFKIDEKQADYVAEIKLRQLNREYLLRRTEEIAGLEDEAASIQGTLGSGKKLDQLISEQLKTYSNQFGRERKTELLKPQEVKMVEEEEMIEDYNLKLFFTQEGYLKKIPLTSLRSAGDLKLKEGDAITQELESSNKTEILFFSDKGQVYKLYAYELEDNKPSEFGHFCPNILELDEREKILFIYPCGSDYSGYLMLIFEDGRAVKVEVSAYETKNRRKKLLNAFYGNSQLVQLIPIDNIDGAGDLLLYSDQQRMVLVDSDLIPFKKTKSSQGIQVMKLRDKQKLTGAKILTAEESEKLSYYRVRTLPSAGRFMKDELIKDKQLDLFDPIQ